MLGGNISQKELGENTYGLARKILKNRTLLQSKKRFYPNRTENHIRTAAMAIRTASMRLR